MHIEGEILEFRLGTPGQGKTLSQNENVVIPALLSGVDVWINYWVNWNLPNLHFFKEFEEVQHLRNCIVVFDEIGRVLEPRAWDSETSGVRDFFQMHRHHCVDIYGTTQHVSLIAKTALIEVDRFLMCSKHWDGWVLKILFPNFPWIKINEKEMTLKEIKLEDSDYIVKDSGEGLDIGSTDSFWFNKKKLIHRELDDYKKELVHRFCPLCHSRKGEEILKENTQDFAYFDDKFNAWREKDNIDLGFCPKHKQERLVLRESAMYDTHYEFPVVARKVVFKPFVKVLKESPFKGTLTPAQLDLKRSLEE